MRKVIAALVMCLGCGSDPVTAPDAQLDAPLGNTFRVPIGAQCSPSPAPLCSGGAGACYEGTCRSFCQLDRMPDMPCALGYTEERTVSDGYSECLCVPR